MLLANTAGGYYGRSKNLLKWAIMSLFILFYCVVCIFFPSFRKGQKNLLLQILIVTEITINVHFVSSVTSGWLEEDLKIQSISLHYLFKILALDMTQQHECNATYFYCIYADLLRYGKTIIWEGDDKLVSIAALCEFHLSSKPLFSINHTWLNLHRGRAAGIVADSSCSANTTYCYTHVHATALQIMLGLGYKHTHLNKHAHDLQN